MHLTTYARECPTKPAVIMAGTGRTLSYGELDAATRHLAHLLRERGLRAGSTVAILMENGPEFIVAALAGQRCGLYFVPVNWHLTAAEIRYVIADSGSEALLTSPELTEAAAEATAGLTAPAHRFVLAAGDPPLPAGFEPAALDTSPLDDEPGVEPNGQFMFYSSGTTGRPKGIKQPLPGEPFGRSLAVEATMGKRYGFTPDSRYLSTGPLYHAAPLLWTLGTIGHGGTAVIMDRFDARAALAAIETERITHAQFVPTMFVRLLKLPETERSRYDLSSLRYAIHAAAPCPVEVKRRMLDWLGPVVYEYYGASEGICYFAIGPTEWLERPGSVGRSVYGTAHVLDENGTELGPGEIGQLWFESATRFEYHNDPDRTASALNRHGWATVGDLGWLDEDGYLYLADRRTDLIISGGVNIYPREIEDALVLHPGVSDVAVFGASDPEMGQRVIAVVQPAHPANGEELRPALSAHLSGRLARFKLPREIYFVPELPRLPSGKVLRRTLRERYEATGRP
jgi:acyl-CoA synthetase (AMP-forming)/AMP-acid ligase II